MTFLLLSWTLVSRRALSASQWQPQCQSLLLSWVPVVCDSEWVTVALHIAFRISVKCLQPYLVVIWLVPQETAAVMVQLLCTPQLYTSLQCNFIRSHIHRGHVCLAVTANCTFGSMTDLFRQHRGGANTKIRVSTGSRPWRRNFSLCSYQDSNPRPCNHESITLPLNFLSLLSHFCSPKIFKRTLWKSRGVAENYAISAFC